jgi:hypothetical protein
MRASKLRFFIIYRRIRQFRDIAACSSAIIAILFDGLLLRGLEVCRARKSPEIRQFEKSVPAAKVFG